MHEIYKQAANKSWELDETEAARLCADIAQNAPEWNLCKSGYGLESGRYQLVFRFKSRPNATDLANPKIEITFAGRLYEAPIGDGIWNILSTAQLAQYTTKISVSIKRGAAAIVREIEDRLLPDYKEVYSLALKEWAKSQADKKQREQMTIDVAAMIGVKPTRHYPDKIDDTVYVGTKDKVGVVVNVGDETHYLQMRSVPTDLLQEIMQAIANYQSRSFKQAA